MEHRSAAAAAAAHGVYQPDRQFILIHTCCDLLLYLQARCSWNEVRAGTKGNASGVYLGDVELETKFCGYFDYIQ
jgi:hypothetical protein